MKKSIFTIVAIMLTATAFAQFTKQGTFLIGGSSKGLSFLAEKSKFGNGDFQDGDKVTSFSISPQVGYFIINNLSVGAGVDFATRTEKFDDLKFTSSSLFFLPFVRYYFDKFYAEGEYGFGRSKFDSEGEVINTGTTWNIGLGYALLLNDAISLEPKIGYGSTTFKNNDFDTANKVSGLSLNLSLFVYLSK